MTYPAFHSTSGRDDFLGLREGRGGAVELVYDDGGARRMIWRLAADANLAGVGEAMRLAVDHLRVVPTLHAELTKRAIAIEAIAG